MSRSYLMLLRNVKPICIGYSRYCSGFRNFSCTTKVMANSSPKEIKIPVPGGCIAGKVWNEGGGKPIIGLHGWMDNAGTWDGIAPLLPKDVSLISIDLPGHGFSPLTQIAGSTFLDLVIYLERVVRHLDLQEVSILGHSMGGGVGMLYASTFPEKVKKLILVDLVKPVSVESDNQPSRTADSINNLFLAEKKLDQNPPSYDYETIIEKLIKGYNGSLTVDSAKKILERGAVVKNGQYAFNFDPRIKVRHTLSMTFEQQKGFARQMNCDMLLIKASKGPFYEDKAMYDEMIEIYKKNKSFKYVTVEGTHHVHMNDPHLVAPVICEFLNDDSS